MLHGQQAGTIVQSREGSDRSHIILPFYPSDVQNDRGTPQGGGRLGGKPVTLRVREMTVAIGCGVNRTGRTKEKL